MFSTVGVTRTGTSTSTSASASTITSTSTSAGAPTPSVSSSSFETARNGNSADTPLFDPLGLNLNALSTSIGLDLSEQNKRDLRDAELKHARLAMLAAIGWPLQEIVHPQLASWAGAKNMLVDGKSPSLLNGGLEQLEIVPALSLTVFVASILELNELRSRRSFGLDAAIAMVIDNDMPLSRPNGQLTSGRINAFESWSLEEQKSAVDAVKHQRCSTRLPTLLQSTLRHTLAQAMQTSHLTRRG